ncbi:lipase 1 [Manduca sexta]|uniref:lipase 1 n=1 Tax=Manduca sexta TaxID=7130 RepID=UPI00188DEA7C|nr:lipase 1 [Manduca sexta]XP_037293414.1 lipase 1 [Manduca sexta]XP_037293415.1 lipase 1 [Manduca sexta]XP_037293416.1 lipase 1 [Manduca sexta]
MKIFHRMPSDSSDVDATPKKRTVLKYTEGDLPTCEEIKQLVKSNLKNDTYVFSSDSENENNSQEDNNLFSKRRRRKTDAKLDLTKNFEALPTRVISRVRKPVEKGSRTILTPKYVIEQEDGIDKEIVTENISRIKTILEKTKAHKKGLPNKSQKSRLNINNKTIKQDIRRKTSKWSKSKLNDKSSLEITKIVTRNEFKNKDFIVKTKCPNKRITDNKKYRNGNKNENEQRSPKKVQSKTMTKTSNTMQIEPQTHNPTKASMDSTVGFNQNNRKTRKSYKVDNSIASPEPRRSRRTKATKDVKENGPTPPKPKSILKRLKRSELNILSPTRFRSFIIQNSGLRPLKSQTS